ncbi:hypothetical protein Daus18300_012322 [Diaporthe australafricana]|uniref:Manganese/iron superoxide dismutase C-terminal domain-containing protein n=1 Tax=Diaporthe australafricana TaxID=127596 RepID=A0ABR3W396_9PEZI
MFKPRLRISRRAGAARLSSAAPRPAPSSSPFVVPARQQQQQQQRSLHASPARRLHEVAPLTDDGRFERNGVAGLFSPESYNIAYNSYQTWALDKLNQMTAGTPYESKSTLETLIATAREPHLAATFNYASMAHNNHFFFEGLSKTAGENKDEHMPTDLRKALEMSFGSLESLRRELVLTADSMFGPGFVWLVQQTDAAGAQARPFKVLATYQAGSPYPSAHWRSQGVDMNNHGGAGQSGSAINEYFDRQNMANRRAPLHGSATAANTSRVTRMPPGGTNIVPVLCVNTWEHVWMWDYGVAGKMEFVDRWWDCINWGRVNELARIDGGHKMGLSPKFGRSPADVLKEGAEHMV